MEKIFDKEVEKYLKESGVSDTEINKIKFNAVKSAVIKRLQGVTGLIELDKYNEICKYTAFSPAGDYMGCNNSFIDFGFIVNEHSPMDILEITNILKEYGNRN